MNLELVLSALIEIDLPFICSTGVSLTDIFTIIVPFGINLNVTMSVFDKRNLDSMIHFLDKIMPFSLRYENNNQF